MRGSGGRSGARELLVIGGGNSALEEGMFLSQFAGDVRQGSTKQLGAAVGEGITALLMVREHHHVAAAAINDWEGAENPAPVSGGVPLRSCPRRRAR